jgi:hypothetical protein
LKEFATSGGEYLYELTASSITFQVPDHTVEVRGSGEIPVDDTRYEQPEEVENQIS